jgi:hypothetical protein
MRLVLIMQPSTPMDEEYSTWELSLIVPVDLVFRLSWVSWKCGGWYCGAARVVETAPRATIKADVESDFMIGR